MESWERVDILKNAGVPADRLSLSKDGSYLAAAFGLFHRGKIYLYLVYRYFTERLDFWRQVQSMEGLSFFLLSAANERFGADLP